MKTFLKTATALATIGFIATAGQTKAEAAELTLCWAAWDPANALVELSKDFEAQTGTTMKLEFVPWPNFADRMLNELNSGGKLCDLMIGDSQWIGGAAENGQYVKLNDFFDKEGIKMSDFIPATVVGYAEWPDKETWQKAFDRKMVYEDPETRQAFVEAVCEVPPDADPIFTMEVVSDRLSLRRDAPATD